MILFEKFGQHQPLNRQAERYAKEGVPLELVDPGRPGGRRLRGAGTAAQAYRSPCPRGRTIARRRHDRAGPGQGQDRHRAMLGLCARRSAVRRHRAAGGDVLLLARPRRRASRRRISPDYAGIFQADAYGGYNRLYEPDRKPGPILEAACWAHARRPFFVMADVAENARRKAQGKTPAPISPLALEAVRRIDALFEIERVDQWPERRAAPRCSRRSSARHLVADLESWMREQRAKLSRGNDVAKAIDYMLKRWTAFTRFLDDGRICLSNNAAERALRGIAVLESLCIPSSSVCKHWNRVVVSDATRATFSGHRVFDRLRRQVGGANLVRRAGHNLHRWQRAGFDQAAYCVACGA